MQVAILQIVVLVVAMLACAFLRPLWAEESSPSVHGVTNHGGVNRNLASQVMDSLSIKQLTSLGLEALQNKNFVEAQKHFLQALNREPSNAALRINLALCFEALAEPQKALREYALALRFAPPQSEARFVALFNMARLYGAWGDVEAALDFYQQALSLRPMSKEVKTNIELLLKKKPPSQSQCNSGQQKQQQNNPQNQAQPQPQPQPQQQDQNKASSEPKPQEKLSPKKMQNILDNITQQEKKIRQRLNEKKAQPNKQGKNW